MRKNKFRIPRKEKKKINKLMFLLYPADEHGNSLMADPLKIEEDYIAFKEGIVKPMINYTKADLKQKLIAWGEKFNSPIEISDEELLEAVNNIFAKEYRDKAYKTFLKAKTHNIAIKDYYNFVNAWKHTLSGDDCSGTACMTLDSAEDNLKRSKPRNKK